MSEPLTKKKSPRNTVTVHRPAVPPTAKRHYKTVATPQEALCSNAVDRFLSTTKNELRGPKRWSLLGCSNNSASAKIALNVTSRRHAPRSAANNFMSLVVGLIIIGMQTAIILVRVPAKVVVAVFSRQPPWCSSSPKTSDHCCVRPSHSTDSEMWAVDALFFDFSV